MAVSGEALEQGNYRKPAKHLSFEVEDPDGQETGDGSVEAAPLLSSGSQQGQHKLGRVVSKYTLVAEDDTSWRAYRHEAKRLSQLAVPLAGAHFFNFALSMISVAFIGRLGEFELSVAVLATSFFNVTGLSIIIGFLGAQETLCGQAFGAKQYRAVGIVLQRTLLITLLLGALICALWSQMEHLMLAMGQDPVIAAGAARYLHLAMPGLLVSGAFESIKRYLMAQGIVKPSTVVACVAVALSPLYNWLLIFKLGWGLDGAVLAMVAADVTMLVFLALWTLWHHRALAGRPQQTWHGWSLESLRGWGSFLRLALPSTVMVCVEWWAFELCVLMSGWLPNPSLHVAVMGLCMNVQVSLYMFPMGLSSATTVRVSNALGAGLPSSAKRTALTAGTLVFGIELVLTALVVATRGVLGYVFTDVKEVIDTTAAVLPVLALSLFGDGMNCVLSGVLRGAGRQGLGAALNISTFWCMGLPLAGLLAFKAHLGITGLWAGLAATTMVQAVAIMTIVLRFNWEREAERAAANFDRRGEGEEAESQPIPSDVGSPVLPRRSIAAGGEGKGGGKLAPRAALAGAALGAGAGPPLGGLG
ncbi:hypothetical protein N2152v2_004837 [Parachlorella kessleri]